MPWYPLSNLEAACRYMAAQLRRGGRMPVYAPGGVVPTPNPQAIPPDIEADWATDLR
jgi:hypothetical protein